MDQHLFYLPQHRLGPLLGIGVQHAFRGSDPLQIEQLQTFLDEFQGSYIFGALSYELKNDFEALSSLNEDRLDFPYFHFWVPTALYKLDEQIALIWGEDSPTNLKAVQYFWQQLHGPKPGFSADFKERTQKEVYFERFAQVKNALQRGDIYELNYCQEFYAEDLRIENPVGLFSKLHELTRTPHATFVQTPDHYVFCASPERYLLKDGQTLRSEPIKGTAPRSENPIEDQGFADQLKNDPKERAENIMIVDLVRNDLSQLAQKGSVKVEELCEIYSFETVHQMISKISCQLKPGVNFTDILRSSFPMGSMTGAPKIAAMQHIEQIEDFQRGLYSGSIGLIEPNSDFDFNVVIRSLIYNRKNNYLSCAVGSAITIEAEPENEYQECLLKANKLIYGLQS